VTQCPGDPISACPGWTASPGTALAPWNPCTGRRHMTLRTVVFLAAVACLLTMPLGAEGACLTSAEPPDRNSPHQFVGAFIERLSSLAAAKTEEWTGLNHIAAASVYVLVKFGKNGAPTRRLRITRSERQELLQKLERAFGSGIRIGLRSAAGDAVNAADGAA